MKQLMRLVLSTVLVLFVGSASAQADSPEKRGSDWLGKGYRGYENYADLKSLTSYSVFDMRGVNVLVSDVKGKEIQVYTGTTNDEYYTNRFANFNVSPTYNLYTGTLNSNFNHSTLTRQDVTIATGVWSNYNYRLTVPDNTPLTNEFRSDLANMEPNDLFDKYGTHVLMSFIVGARYEISSYLSTQDNKDTATLSSSLSGGLKDVFTASAGGGGTSSSLNKAIVDRKLIQTYGGGVEDDFKSWFNNLVDSNSAIADFDKFSLKPIYELVTNNNTRRAQLQDGFTRYMNDNMSDVMRKKSKGDALTALKYGDKFKLQTIVNGQLYWISVNSEERPPAAYTGGVPMWLLTATQYYPQVLKANAVELYFEGGPKGSLVNRQNSVTLSTSESSTTWMGTKYNSLGMWGWVKNGYSYAAIWYKAGYDEQKWVVTVKSSAGSDPKNVYYGDQVEISMFMAPDWVLCKSGNYLYPKGTSGRTCESSLWTIAK